jgi:hypothetical protein
MSTSSIRFTREWRSFARSSGEVIYRPMLPILLRGRQGFVEAEFLVDSGADLSMAPHAICRQLGLRWSDGDPSTIQGISRRSACTVLGRIHNVDILVPDGGVMLRLPMAFVRGNAPFVLGRDGFFDAFEITFDATNHRSVFHLVED